MAKEKPQHPMTEPDAKARAKLAKVQRRWVRLKTSMATTRLSFQAGHKYLFTRKEAAALVKSGQAEYCEPPEKESEEWGQAQHVLSAQPETPPPITEDEGDDPEARTLENADSEKTVEEQGDDNNEGRGEGSPED